MEQFSVIWKGTVVAQKDRADICAEFERGAYGFLHSVQLGDGRILSVPDFLRDPDFKETPQQIAERGLAPFDFQLFGFILCGFSFLSFYIYAALLLYAVFLFVSKRKNMAFLFALLGAVMAFAGMFFFELISSQV